MGAFAHEITPEPTKGPNPRLVTPVAHRTRSLILKDPESHSGIPPVAPSPVRR